MNQWGQVCGSSCCIPHSRGCVVASTRTTSGKIFHDSWLILRVQPIWTHHSSARTIYPRSTILARKRGDVCPCACATTAKRVCCLQGINNCLFLFTSKPAKHGSHPSLKATFWFRGSRPKKGGLHVLFAFFRREQT